MRLYSAIVIVVLASSSLVTAHGAPKPGLAESATIKVLTGLTVPVRAGNADVRGREKKVAARRMIEMTKQINAQYLPRYTPPEGESKLGRVTCITCHQGEQRPQVGE